MRIGLGQDSHRFSNSPKPLVFGGVKFDEYPCLKGNSDADVLIHSLCNALSSTVGGESLSIWTDNMCQQGIIDSREYLKHINSIVSKDFVINNISISVEAQIPRLSSDQKSTIKQQLANILEISTNQIGITYTSGEDLTSFGQKKGIQVFSTVLLSEK